MVALFFQSRSRIQTKAEKGNAELDESSAFGNSKGNKTL